MVTGGIGFHTVGVWLPYVLLLILSVGPRSQCRVITCGSHLKPKTEPPRTTSVLVGQSETELMNQKASTLRPTLGQLWQDVLLQE